ncbi:hypothetical protein EDD16DRAFT_1049879 [Pisolithus croceorrhizus]|nr:hypothetical protein EDD16DRAFT_1049879 [Pisolithus croceorrhizus]
MYFQNPIWWCLSFARLLLYIPLQVLVIMQCPSLAKKDYHIYVPVVRAPTRVRQQCWIELVLALSLPSRHGLGS